MIEKRFSIYKVGGYTLRVTHQLEKKTIQSNEWFPCYVRVVYKRLQTKFRSRVLTKEYQSMEDIPPQSMLVEADLIRDLVEQSDLDKPIKEIMRPYIGTTSVKADQFKRTMLSTIRQMSLNIDRGISPGANLALFIKEYHNFFEEAKQEAFKS